MAEDQPIVPTINEEAGYEQSTNPALRPGTPWGDRLAENKRRVDAAKTTPLRQNIADGFKSTAAYAVGRNVSQRVDTREGLLSTIGQTVVAATGQAGKWGDSDWDKDKYYDELTEGMSNEHKDAIMAQTSYEGAQLTRKNIEDDLARYDRMGLTRGTATVMQLAGSLPDVDAPLVLLSGGGFGIAKAAGRAAWNAQRITRGMGLVSGAAAGLQAGAAVGALDALNRDTTSWMDAVRMTLMTTAAGGAIGAAAPKLMLPMKQIERDFRMRMERGDPTVWDEPLSTRQVDPSADRIIIEEEVAELAEETADDMSVGAAAAPGTTRAGLRPVTGDTVDLGGQVVTGRQRQWIEKAREWTFNSGYKEKYKAAMENWVDKAFASRIMNIGTNDVMRLVKSRGSVANWLSGTIFEVASGVVRGDTTTAAVQMRQYQGRLSRHLNDEPKILGAWAKANGRATMDPTGNFVIRVKPDGYRDFYKQAMLDIEAEATIRAGGKATRSADPHVREMADRFIMANEEALQIMKGRQGETAVRGFENALDGVPYMPYRWHPATMMAALARKDSAGNPLLTTDMMVEGFAAAYIAKGTFTDPEVAKQAADALVQRFVARGRGQDDSIMSMLTKDGRDYIEQSMKGLGRYTDQEIENFMRRFDSQMEERSKAGFAKSRSEIDLNTAIKLRDGSEMRIIDFMDPDFSATQQRYLRQVAGHSALARKGITHKGERGELIAALRAEQRAMGEDPIDDNLLEAMFSEFDGAAQIGSFQGQNNAGIGAMAELKALGSLSMLQLNGFAQAAETGVGVFAVGMDNWFTRGIKPMFDKAIRDGNDQVFEELSFLTGMIGRDQDTFRPHLAIDEANDYTANNAMTRGLSQARALIAQGNNIQGYTSGLNAIRGFQQKVAWLGMSDRILRTIADDVAGVGGSTVWKPNGRMYRDLGLDTDHYHRLRDLVEDGTIEFKTTKSPTGKTIRYVNKLNLDKWDADLAQDFSSALARNEAQLVQRPLAGETDRWMHTHLGAFLSHLKTFPLLAIQKQGARHAAQADMQAMAVTLGGMATAYAAINMRDILTGRERTPEERFKSAIAYANITGWVSMYNDPVMTALGQHDWRINGFGAYAEPFTTPSLDIANRLIRVPGALASAVTSDEELGGADRSALRAIPFVRLTEMLTSLAGANLLDDPNITRRREARQAAREEPAAVPQESSDALDGVTNMVME